MPSTLVAPSFATRVPIQFLSPDNPALNITGANSLQNNPEAFYIQPGQQAKIELGLNGNTYFRGDLEYAPFALELDWKQLSYTDYLKLAQLRPYFINFVSHRNVGYYGKLLTDGPRSVMKSQDVVTTRAKFYVLTPSDAGGAQTVARLDTPTTAAAVNGVGGSGYIPVSTPVYYWLTFTTILGETLPQNFTVTTGVGGLSRNTITWTWPSSGYLKLANIYVSGTNNSTTSKLLGSVFNGEPATWVDLVGFAGALINQQPPLANTAYRGSFNAGIFYNEVP